MYYKNKIETLKDIFATEDIVLDKEGLTVDGRRYPILEDVIILSGQEKQSDLVKKRLGQKTSAHVTGNDKDFAKDIQYTFGQEWNAHNKILPEHRDEFLSYFDIVDLCGLKSARICDLGCGSGRWSYFLKDRVKEIILVDFSDAIFAARENLKGSDNCLFFIADLKELPFKDDFAQFLFCLGVLHHLPTSCLDEVRELKRFSERLLIYLYYALDDRPVYFRIALKGVDILRAGLSKIRSAGFRKVFSLAGTFFIYIPLILLGRLFSIFGLGRSIPLYEGYRGKSIKRIEQDVYDRFFTRIEQRVSKKDIEGLRDTFSDVAISEKMPYWHFLCQK